MSELVAESWRHYLCQLQLHPLRTKVTSSSSSDSPISLFYTCFGIRLLLREYWLVNCSGTIAQKISGAKKLQLRRLLLIMKQNQTLISRHKIRHCLTLQHFSAMLNFSRRIASSASSFLTGRFSPAIFCRSYGAAAVEFAGDSDWEDEDRFNERRVPIAVADVWGSRKERGVQWLFMGSPSSQKRDYATRIARLLEVPYISMGSLVRQELHPHSSIYMKIANAVNEGKLVTEEVIFGLLSKRLEEGYHRGESGFILNGIPRTIVQAEILDQIADIDLVVNLKSSEDCLLKKHIGNDICAHCGKIYDCFNSQSTPVNPCLATSKNHCKLDTSATFDMDKSRLEKLQIYSEQKKELEDYYRQQKKLLDFHVSGGPSETWRGLLAALHLRPTQAARLSQKLNV